MQDRTLRPTRCGGKLLMSRVMVAWGDAAHIEYRRLRRALENASPNVIAGRGRQVGRRADLRAQGP